MFEEYCIAPGFSLLEAMRKINDSAIATVVVCDGGKALGILTDGDIRRALIGGASLNSCIDEYYTKDFISVEPAAMRADVLDLMQARTIEQVPIVDDRGMLKGIHTLHNLLGHEERPNRALIMAGGKGTRLGKLTESTPKPMLKVAGRPILERLILHLVGHGIKHIYISVNHLSGVIEEYFGEGSRFGCAIEYLHEVEPLGSGGALSLIQEELGSPLVMLNGDLLIEANLHRMLAFHEANDYHATMGVHCYAHEVPFGCVDEVNGKMSGLKEKPLLSKVVNAGVYVLSPLAVREVPKGTPFPVTDLFQNAMDRELPCGVFHLDGEWMDVGLPEQLGKARGRA